MRRARRAAGFTLVELVVAMAVFLVFIAAAFGSFSTVYDSIARGQEQGDLYQTGRVLLAELSAQLVGAYQPPDSSTCTLVGEDTPGSAGGLEADTVTFLTAAHPEDDEEPTGGLAQMTYSMGGSSSDERPGLYVEKNWTPGLEVSEDPAERHLLSPLVVGFNCKYLPVEGDWETEWMDRTTLPMAVRVELTLLGRGEQAKPLVLVSTTNLAMATAPAGEETDALQ
jgi:prepilin-type N-terminal cleavage/methylation domain-containing protein